MFHRPPEGERLADSGGARRPRPPGHSADPRTDLLRLQRSAGNRVVGNLLANVQRDPGDGDGSTGSTESSGSTGRSENVIPYEERMANNRRAMDVIASSDAPIVMSWSQRMFRRGTVFGTMGSAPGLSSAEFSDEVISGTMSDFGRNFEQGGHDLARQAEELQNYSSRPDLSEKESEDFIWRRTPLQQSLGLGTSSSGGIWRRLFG